MNDSWGATLVTGGQISIDLAAVAANYTDLVARAAPAEVAAVVKADAYGLGLEPVCTTLRDAGCRHFFVADLDEALELRRVLSESAIYVLGGLWAGTEATALTAGLTPVLNSLGQLERWRDLARTQRRRLPAVIQVDTGMSRLGLSPDQVDRLAQAYDVFDHLDIRYVMSHLACADSPSSPVNHIQEAAFTAALRKLPPTPVSFANSAATLTHGAAAGDLMRCGLALYGGAAVVGEQPLRTVFCLSARVIQMRTIAAGQGVGYGHDFVAAERRRIATVAIGYADGLPRSLSGKGAMVFAGERLPIVGRVSMDTAMVDATALPPGALQPGDLLEVIGPHQSLEALAEAAGTISYEILARLGRRFRRFYSPSRTATA
ncbi:alanine racemase [Phenylobacterium sp.]|uniref:alanine racemase n=1 Tax=Phenylobacterium sp. TaxID=1871053 RepID=UPI002D7FE19D|nr:alanine racemase [Phenylobacterium sp.]